MLKTLIDTFESNTIFFLQIQFSFKVKAVNEFCTHFDLHKTNKQGKNLSKENININKERI